MFDWNLELVWKGCRQPDILTELIETEQCHSLYSARGWHKPRRRLKPSSSGRTVGNKLIDLGTYRLVLPMSFVSTFIDISMNEKPSLTFLIPRLCIFKPII